MSDSKKTKILIVDDDDVMNTILVDKLKLSGYDATGAINGEEGLKQALHLHPDVILLDLLMPKMSGLDMLKKLREDTWGSNARVVILTMLEKSNYAAEALENNVSGYIVKTNYSLDGLVKKIEEII